MSKNCIAYIGDRNKGKTERLYNKICEGLKNKKKVLVVDSATEHYEKSIVMRLKRERGIDVHTLFLEENERISDKNESWIFNYINDMDAQLFLFDVSYHLERGYNYPEGEERINERRKYKEIAMKISEVLIDRVDLIIWDEIELIQESRNILEQINRANKKLYMTLHYTETVEDMKDYLVIERV